MTADEIRNLNDSVNKAAVLSQESLEAAAFGVSAIGAKVLIEIAAQLAELNHKLDLFTVNESPDFKSIAITVMAKEEEAGVGS